MRIRGESVKIGGVDMANLIELEVCSYGLRYRWMTKVSDLMYLSRRPYPLRQI